MKKNQLTALLLTAAMSVSLLAGCGNSADTSTPSAGTASGTEGLCRSGRRRNHKGIYRIFCSSGYGNQR